MIVDKLRALALFIWDFVVGDDWRLAAGVVIGLALTALVAGLGVTAWWLLPVLVGAILGVSVWRAAQHRLGPELTRPPRARRMM